MLAILGICACATEPLPPGQTISMGTSAHGYLHEAVPLADRGEGYLRIRPGEATRYGSHTLVRAIERAARAVSSSFPGGEPLRVGDLSGKRGGAHPRHRTHRSGRDADLLFFARDAGGLSVENHGFAKFDRFGWAAADGRALSFDDARNWHVVRTLVMDPEARVKWIFCSNELKARLLRYAAQHEPFPEAVLRATWVLHQPSRGDPHDDHFHLRVGCSEQERALGCREQAPHWPWLGDPARKATSTSGVAASDERLVGWLLAEEHVDEGRDVVWRRLGAATKPPLVARR